MRKWPFMYVVRTRIYAHISMYWSMNPYYHTIRGAMQIRNTLFDSLYQKSLKSTVYNNGMDIKRIRTFVRRVDAEI